MFLTRDTSPEFRAIVWEIAAAETRDEVTEALDRLELVVADERERAEAAERERRRRTGAVRLLPKGTAQKAADEFNRMIADAKRAQPVDSA